MLLTDRRHPASAHFPSHAVAICIAFVALCLVAALPVRGQDPDSLLYSPSSVYSGAYSPKGTWFAMGGDDLILYKVDGGKQVGLLNPGALGAVVAMQFSADERKLAVLYSRWERPAKGNIPDRDIVILSVPEGKELARFACADNRGSYRPSIFLNPDATRVATSSFGGITVYDTSNGKVTWTYKPDEKKNKTTSADAFDVTPDWSYFLFNMVRIAYPKGSTDRAVTTYEKGSLWSNRISADGTRAIATSSTNGATIGYHDLDSGERVKPSPRWNINTNGCVALTPDGKTAVFNRGVWDLDKNIPFVLNTRESDTKGIAVAPDGMEYTFATERVDLSIKPPKMGYWVGNKSSAGSPSTFKPDTGTLGDTPLPKIGPYTGTDMTPQPNKGDFDKSVWRTNASRTLGTNVRGTIFFPTESGKEPVVLKERTGRPTTHFLGDDSVLMIDGSSMYRYSSTTGKTVTGKATEHEVVYDCVASGDGKWLTRHAGDRTFLEEESVEVYDTATLKPVITVQNAPRGGSSFSLDSSKLAIWSGRQATVYTCGNWKKTRTFTVPLGRLHGASFSPDNSLLALANRNGVTWVYAVADGPLTYLLMPRDATSSVYIAYDPTGKPVPTK